MIIKCRYFFLAVFTLLFCQTLRAQNPVININATNISGGDIVITDNSFTSNSCLISLLGTIAARATSDFTATSTGTTLTPSVLSKVKLRALKIGSSDISSSTSAQTLSTTNSTLYTALLALASGGAVNLSYTIYQAEISNYAWLAGSYSTGIIFTTPGGLACLGTSTFNATLTISVTPFITFPTLQNMVFTVDDFKYFRNTAVSNTVTFSNRFTVPLGLRVKAAATNFTYTNGYAGANNPLAPLNSLRVNMSSPTLGSSLSISATYQNIAASPFAVPVGNTQSTTLNFSINPSDLKAKFIQKGTYSSSIDVEAFDGGTVVKAGSVAKNTLATINVADMGELVIGNTDVSLNISSEDNFTNGISVDVPNQLKVSKTTPYDVYVKAASDNLSNNSNLIPVNCISIGPAAGQTGVGNVVLSSVAQKIISAAAPVVDRNISLNYSIPSNKTAALLGKVPGTYATVITYSFVAP